MYRATTPTHRFVFTQAVDDADEILITYSQNEEIILEKRKDDLTFSADGKTAEITLTQNEANRFDANPSVWIQARLRFDDTVVATDMVNMSVYKVLNDEILE